MATPPKDKTLINPLTRETWDDDGQLDEIVGFGADVHIERMSKRWWWASIRFDGHDYHLDFKDLRVENLGEVNT